MEEYKKKTTKPWQLKEWRENRKKIIGDKCVRCGSSEPPLVVQHKWHPPSYNKIHKEIMNQILLQKIHGGIEKSNEEILKPYKDQYLTECCPKCERKNFKERKSMSPKYKCYLCNYEFEEPGKKFNRKHPEVTKIISNHWKAMYQRHKSEIKKEVDSINSNYHKKYMEMVNCSTYCKKCAYLEDIHKQELCQVCKTNYHPVGWKSCRDCMMIAFKDEETKRKIGQKNEKCNNCFWFIANPDTWKDFNGTPLKLIEVKERKCNACKGGTDNFSEVWRCKSCNKMLDGHNYFLHGELCDDCSPI